MRRSERRAWCEPQRLPGPHTRRLRGLFAWVTLALALVPSAKAQAKAQVSDGWFKLGQESDLERRELKHRTLPNLVKVQDLKVTMLADGFASTFDQYEGPAKLVVTGKLVHPYSTTVTDVLIRIGFMPGHELERTWFRLMTSPLVLTEAELKRPLPYPSLHWTHEATPKNIFAPKSSSNVRIETSFRDLRVDLRALPQGLVMLDEYVLEDPSTEDLMLILKRGGVTDLAAATNWARSAETRPPKWKPKAREALMDTILRGIEDMRPPLSHSGLQRLNALLAVTKVAARPADLERLLIAKHSVKVLMTSASLSYYDAVRDEKNVDLPVHKIRSLPSLLEYVNSYKRALQEIRHDALPELVELAFDPLDFRNAPKDGSLRVSSVQHQARTLLEPLTPLDVSELLQSAMKSERIQTRLLQFYIRARHAPAISTLLFWLHEHPKKTDTLGIHAAQTMGTAVVPALLSQYLEPRDRIEREISRKMLLALPKASQDAAVAALRGRGAMLPKDASIKDAIAAFESHEDRLHKVQADRLESTIFGPQSSGLSAVRLMVLTQELARFDPKRIETRHQAILKNLRYVAIHTQADAPAHSQNALDLHTSLPFGKFADEAKMALRITQSMMAQKNGKLDRAIKFLAQEDEAITDDRVAIRFGELSRLIAEQAIEEGHYGRAQRAIDRAKAQVEDEDRLEALERKLFWAKYWPAFVLAGLALSSTTVLLSYLFAKRLAKRWTARRKRRALARNPVQSRQLSLRDHSASLDVTQMQRSDDPALHLDAAQDSAEQVDVQEKAHEPPPPNAATPSTAGDEHWDLEDMELEDFDEADDSVNGEVDEEPAKAQGTGADAHASTEAGHAQESDADTSDSSESMKVEDAAAEADEASEPIQPEDSAADVDEASRSMQPEGSGSDEGEAREPMKTEDSTAEADEASKSMQPEDAPADPDEASEPMKANEGEGSEIQPEDSAADVGEASEAIQPEDSAADVDEASKSMQPQDSAADVGEASEVMKPEDSAADVDEASKSMQPQDSAADVGEASEAMKPEDFAADVDEASEPNQPRKFAADADESSEPMQPAGSGSESDPPGAQEMRELEPAADLAVTQELGSDSGESHKVSRADTSVNEEHEDPVTPSDLAHPAQDSVATSAEPATQQHDERGAKTNDGPRADDSSKLAANSRPDPAQDQEVPLSQGRLLAPVDELSFVSEDDEDDDDAAQDKAA